MSKATEVETKIEQLEVEVEVEVEVQEQVAKSEPEAEDIWKGVHPSIRKRLEEAEAIAKAERNLRLDAEYIRKAAEFTNLSLEAEKFGPTLRKMADWNPEITAEVLAILKAADEIRATGEIFKTAGQSSEGGSGSAVAQLEGKAAELQKSDPSLTKEQAFTKALRSDPSLYQKYLSEQDGE